MEITANAIQTVASGSNVVFTETAVSGSSCILHREGAGLVTLRGLTNQRRARFKISFGSNVALPIGTNVKPIALVIGINGEPVQPSSMISSPSAANSYNNVYSSIFIDVPSGCCTQISVENIGETGVNVQNASLIVERVA